MNIARRYTTPDVDPLTQVNYEIRQSVISNPDGSIVFEAKDVQTPKQWTQLATDIVVSKYFRRAGVPTPQNRETGVQQVIHRIIHTIRMAGEQMGGYFTTTQDADAFEFELKHAMVHQLAAFNSPVWFNCGLFHEYGITGGGGAWAWDAVQKDIVEIKNAYERPQCSACFIQSIDDDLMSIFDLVKTEARIFKYGSGTGTNFSKLRSKHEKLSGGGTSSGLMSFLEVFDRSAGATKSGGTTRRAAKMVCLDMDHPEIVDFIEWKVREEEKARILIEKGGFPADFNGEAYHTISGQNANNSVRVSDAFMNAVLENGSWSTYARTTGKVIQTYDAVELFDRIAMAAWKCADPGLQYDTTINEWHTCINSDRIYASNPCSEYMFLDNSACNLASINLLKFIDDQGQFDIEGFQHVVRLCIIAQDILVDFSSYPTAPIAKNSHYYRPLGLGYANLGAMLMVLGIPYDSPQGCAMTSAITAIMTGTAYHMSAQLAAVKGPFDGYAQNAEPMMRVMRKHREAVEHINPEFCDSNLRDTARAIWDNAIEEGQNSGFRNAQTTVIAPTGTIGLLMDCDTTGIEPDFALVKFKKLAGGGYFKIINGSVPRALKHLGYTPSEINDMIEYINGTGSFEGAPFINPSTLRIKGFTDEDLSRLSQSLQNSMDLNSVFSVWNMGDSLLNRLGLSKDRDILAQLGFTDSQIDAASDHIIGTMTIEGAPHLQSQHLPVFDCANRCGPKGERFIAPMGHVRIMAATQPFISGAISKTVNLPNEATIEEIRNLYIDAWKMGLKAIALYRDGCKMSQPLSSTRKKDRQETSTESTDELVAPIETVEAFEAVANQLEKHAQPLTPAPQLPTPTLLRKRMPQRRRGFTVEARVGGHKVYLRTGEYEDGTLGEIFIDMHKEGAAFRSMMNCFAIAVSKGLQYGVPLQEFVDTFSFTRFEPQGMVNHPNIKTATSIVDYVFRVLGLEYLGRTDQCHVQPALPPVNGTSEILSSTSATTSAFEEQAMAEKQTMHQPQMIHTATAPQTNTLTVHQTGIGAQMAGLMGDAPFCDSCGHITVRNGTCYKCLNCGNSMGCS